MEYAELPPGWKETTLGELVTFNPKSHEDNEAEAGFVPMALVPTVYGEKIQYEVREWGKIKKGYTHFRDGDVIFAKITPCFENSKAAIVSNLPNGFGAGSTEYYVLRPYEDSADAKYLYALIKSSGFLAEGAMEMTGAVGHKRVPKDFVLNYLVPLPPLNEQTRIANKLDELLAQVDTIKTRVDAIPAILKRFRQSVLAAAVSGKLTEEWRELNELCEFKSDVEGLSEFRSETLTDLPGSWKWLPFNAIAEIASNLKDPNSEPDSIHIAPNHIESNSGKFLEFRTVAEDGVKSAKHGFVSGQILYSKIRPYLNKVAIAHFSGLCSADMYPIDSKIETKFLFLWMLSFQFVDWASNSGSRVVLPKINQKSLNEIPTPVPSMKEQKQIVSRVEQYFSFADQIEQRVKDAQSRINNLTQSILAKAFRGELVPQDPNDEPASELLERIKKEREQAAVLTKATKKVTKKKAKAE